MRSAGLMLLAPTLSACVPNERVDEARVREMMEAHFGGYSTPLETGPVVVNGDYAIADWTKGSTGGRALLGRHEGSWMLLLCSGDSLRDGRTLRRAGVPDFSADGLAAKLVAAEQAVPASRLALLHAFAKKRFDADAAF